MTVAARVGNGINAEEMENWGRGLEPLPAWNRPGQQVRSFAYVGAFCGLDGVYDKNLDDPGRAALLRRLGIQARAAALPCQEGDESCHAPGDNLLRGL